MNFSYRRVLIDSPSWILHIWYSSPNTTVVTIETMAPNEAGGKLSITLNVIRGNNVVCFFTKFYNVIYL